MPRKLFPFITGATLALLFFRATAAETAPSPAPAAPAPDPVQIVISVPDQRLELVRDGQWLARFPISTSKFGTGDNYGSYRTPLGQLKVCDKIGGDLQPGAVIRHRSATGEVLPVNAPGRDPIVTRVIWLDGLEDQNKNAHSRGIYIHGTPEERTIGMPTSFGCIRMKSKDVIKVFENVPVGTIVNIMPDKLPHMRRYEPPKIEPAPVIPATPETAIAASKTPATKSKPASEPEKTKAPASEEPKAVIASASLAASKPTVSAAPEFPASLPPVAENTTTDHASSSSSSSSAWKAMKGSFLLANIPTLDSDKSSDHRR